MRPKRLTYTLQALDADGYLNDATGAGPWTTILALTTDGAAHKVTIASAANLSALTITVTGTDPNGWALTEAITGPNATTVTSTKYFKTVTGVSSSGTLGANTMDVGWAAACATPTYPVNQYADGYGPSVGVDIGGTVTYTGWQCNGDVYAVSSEDMPWLAISSGMTGATTDQLAAATIATTGIRITVASHTSGALAITYAQGRC